MRDAVVAIENLAAAKVTSPGRIWKYAAGQGGMRRVGVVREAVPLSGEHSRSPNETRLKLIWLLDAGLPAPLVNCPVHDLFGRLLGIADLLDREAGLVVEFDGADHRSARRHSNDVDREAAFRGVGLEVARVTGPDLRQTARVVTRLHQARARARFEPAEQRRWFPKPPVDVLDDLLDDLERARSLPNGCRIAPKATSWERAR